MTFELLPDVIVPVVLGVVSGFGATTYTNHLASKREARNLDDVAESAVRAYENALRNYSVYLEERAIAGGNWDPEDQVMDAGSEEKIRAAWSAAQPYFHRLKVERTERAATANSMPDRGNDPAEGSEKLWLRAEMIRIVLERGLNPRGVKMPKKRSKLFRKT